MSGLGVSFAKAFYAFSGSDKRRLVLHLDAGSLSLSELDFHKKRPFVRVVARHAFSETIEPGDLFPHRASIIQVLEALVEKFGLFGRDVIISAALKDMRVQIVSAFYMTEKEIKIEAEAVEFWREHFVDLGDVDNPYINYKVLGSSEIDDQTTLLAGVCPKEPLLQLTELVSECHLNPVAVIPEPLAIVNSVYQTLSRADRRSSVAIAYLSESGGRVIGFANNQVSDVSFEFNELDRILIRQLENVDDAVGQFWSEVGARVGSSIAQSIEYLEQEQKFIPFRKIVLISGLADPSKIAKLLKITSDLKDVEVWSGAAVLGVEENEVPNASESLFAPSVGAHHSALDAEVTGLPLGEVFADLNMHPYGGRIQSNRRLRGANVFFGVLLAASVLVGAIFTAIHSGPEYFAKKSQAAGSERKISQQKNLQKQLSGANGQVGQLQQQTQMLREVASQNTRYEFFDLFPETVPTGISLTEFKLDRAGTLSIKGVSSSADLVTLFTDNLVRERLMTSPKVAAGNQSGNSLGFGFEIYGKAGSDK